MLKQRELILREIDHLLEAFQEQYSEARQHSGHIPLIEMDLMKQSVRNLYQQLQYLGQRKEIESTITEISVIATEVAQSKEIESPLAIFESRPAVQPMVEKTIPTSLVENISEPTFEITAEPLLDLKIEEPEMEELIQIEEIIPQEIVPEILAETSQPTVDISHRENVMNPIETKLEIPVEVIAEITASPAQEKPQVKKHVAITASLFDEPSATIASKYKEPDTIYDKLAKGKVDESIAAKHQQQPLADLRKSIGINERFSFINELFNGNQKAYYESIDKINSLSDYHEARTLIHGELAVQMNWSPASASFIKLDEMVKRRFSA